MAGPETAGPNDNPMRKLAELTQLRQWTFVPRDRQSYSCSPPSAQGGRRGPRLTAIRGLLDLPADDRREQLVFSSRSCNFAREAADVAAILPALAAVRAHAELAVAVQAVQRVRLRPGQPSAERGVAGAPGLAAVGGDERALL